MSNNAVVAAIRGSKVYELPMTPDYISSWGVQEAVREILQNAIDSDSPLEVTYEHRTLTIQSRYSALPIKSLLLGSTTKADLEDKIGSFGEGYKLALLVLTRGQHSVQLYNDGVLWEPSFETSKTYDTPTLHVTETKIKRGDFCPDGVMFVINDVDNYDYGCIVDKCLHLWAPERLGERLITQRGRILVNQPGKLYVNGLYICDTDMKHSYDVKPEFINLERDRQTVNTYDLYSVAKDMWFDTSQYDDIVNMIEEGARDMHCADWGTPDVVKEACYRHFIKKNPGKIGARNQDEMNRYLEQGMSHVIIVNDTYQTILKRTPEYDEASKLKPQPKPVQVLQTWFENRTSPMDAHDHETWVALMTKALNWK